MTLLNIDKTIAFFEIQFRYRLKIPSPSNIFKHFLNFFFFYQIKFTLNGKHYYLQKKKLYNV